jgi:hypothetical protein
MGCLDCVSLRYTALDMTKAFCKGGGTFWRQSRQNVPLYSTTIVVIPSKAHAVGAVEESTGYWNEFIGVAPTMITGNM